jgi:hypothetical protein
MVFSCNTRLAEKPWELLFVLSDFWNNIFSQVKMKTLYTVSLKIVLQNSLLVITAKKYVTISKSHPSAEN